MTNVDSISELLKPFDARMMRVYPVSSRINQVQNDDEKCARSAPQDQPPQPQLFS